VPIEGYKLDLRESAGILYSQEKLTMGDTSCPRDVIGALLLLRR
jgi:hypothetical protein